MAESALAPVGHLCPGVGRKTHGDASLRPLDDRALDDAGLLLHEGCGTGRILGGGLGVGIELAPRRALAVEQLFPADSLHPGGQLLGGNTLFLEVVEFVGDALVGEPGAGLLDGVAIGYSINNR